MKKILFSIFALGLALTSCDMDQNAPGSLTDSESVKTAADVQAFRNNVYSSMRALTSGTYVTNTELQMDQFNALQDQGGHGMRFSAATINPSTTEITDDYQGCYAVLKNINFTLPQAQALIDNGAVFGQDINDVKRYIGELHFFRAYIYYWLFDHYCQSYSADKADQEGLGCQLVTVYDPTGDTSKYPGRSSMRATVDLINSDLQKAYDDIKAFEGENADEAATLLAPNTHYISSLCVAAMQARMALLTKDYTTAIAKSQEVINSGKFPLAEDDDYYDMWIADEGSELIWLPFANSAEAAYIGSLMDAWAYYSTYPTRVDYVPSARTLNAYGETRAERNKDIRFDSFFSNRTAMNPLQVAAQNVTGYIFTKWPGNSALVSGTNYYKNAPKPFRIAEQYLILAEAAAEAGQDAIGLKALNDLRKARITGYTDAAYSGQALVNAVREERAKELIGEGFRMSDLRRWNLGFTRDGSNPGSESMQAAFVQANLNISYIPGDYRYVWPIPYEEMQIAPALKGQQNPGY